MTTIALNAARDNALEMATERGWHVFPIRMYEKRPAATNGQNDATNDPEQILRDFRQGFGNVGIHCRPSGLYVIDIDMNPWRGKVGKASWAALEAEHGRVDTFSVRTWSGGLHLYYADTEGVLTNTTSVLGPDIDTRGNGYVVAAPSFVREEGHEGAYSVLDDIPVAPLPDWIRQALTKAPVAPHVSVAPAAEASRVTERVRELAAELSAAPHGKANHLAASLSTKVGNYVGAGQIDQAGAEQIMLGAVAGWSWDRPEHEDSMHATIRRQIAFGAQRDDRPWEAPVSVPNGGPVVYDPWTKTMAPDTTPARPPLAAVPDAPAVANAVIVPEVGHGQYRMAQRMLRSHGNDLRYSSALGWHVWDGTRWCPDEDGATVRCGQQVINDAWADVPNQGDAEARKKFCQDIGKIESASGMEGMLYSVRAMQPVAAGKDPFDNQAHLFNTPDGTVDLLAGIIREHRREDMNAKRSRTGIGQERSEVFESFLETILPDTAVRSYVQRLLGQAMLGRVEEHILPIFTGTGANGKGTLRDALVHAFGEYAIEVDPEILMEQKNAQHKTFLMELKGRRLIFCSETDKDRKFAEATMKRLVGGDEIQANRMHKDPITFIPSHTMIMLTNHLPQVSGDDMAVWRRIQVVPFDVVIPDGKKDGTLPSRLKDAAPAVLAWVYEGWLEYQKQGLNPPDAVKARTDAYRAANDTVGRFLSERTIPNSAAATRASDVYEAYAAWAREEGEPVEPVSDFGKSMVKHDVKKVRRSAGVVYLGFLIMSDEKEPEEDPAF